MASDGTDAAGLVDPSLVRKLSGMLELATESAGLEIVGSLPAEVNDRVAAAAAARHGVEVRALSQYAVKLPTPSALILGFAAVNAQKIDTGLGQLAAALREVMERQSIDNRNGASFGRYTRTCAREGASPVGPIHHSPQGQL